MSQAPSPRGPLCLNPNVDIVAVSQYPADIRERLGGAPDDFIVSERRSRYAAHRVGPETAAFLRRFCEPRTVAEAVVEQSLAQAEDPVHLAAQLLPLVARLCAERILVTPGAMRPARREPHFQAGVRLGAFELVACIDAQAETEVYAARGPNGAKAALKWIPEDAPDLLRTSLQRECEILKRLEAADMPGVPRVLEPAPGTKAPFLALSWCEGRDLLAWSRDSGNLTEMRIVVAARLADLYARLHDGGVLHGDVHGRNVLVDAEGQVSVIDFGAARISDAPEDRPRVGLLTDYEPEAAQAALQERPLPLTTPRSEQYALAAMIYRIITGAAYLRLSLESRVALKQIAEELPRRFADLGLPWPGLEAVLARALAKDPEDRWPSVAAFAQELRAATAVGATRPRPEVRKRIAPTNALVTEYGLESSLLAHGLARGPTASLYYGAAGIAWALLRTSVVTQDAAALAAAEVWIQQAFADRSRVEAFEGVEVGVTPEMVGRFALFGAEPGLHYTLAMVRCAEGDSGGFAAAVSEFLHGLNLCELGGAYSLDLMNGAAGLLVATSQLLATCDASAARETAALGELGGRLATIVASELEAPAIANCLDPAYLGLAHGRAGALYALIDWTDGRPGDQLRRLVERHLSRLVDEAHATAEGLAWPLYSGADSGSAWTGWCHGSAGHVLLWSRAARAGQRDAHADRALKAGEFLWANRAGSGPSLCCGRAGQALSLFELGRLTGDGTWFDRGRKLLDVDTPFHPLAPHSLFRGRLGLELARLEALAPEGSVWPICHSPL
ncbi:phosphotransferase [Phenylobacterium sp. LjRoot225]|uniref:lanthionine synthetase LanC family protein n=1 Tax=Phenylobacterium sp. LjRoot225 TaxID=3342285 RepID=UPI003ECF34AF